MVNVPWKAITASIDDLCDRKFFDDSSLFWGEVNHGEQSVSKQKLNMVAKFSRFTVDQYGLARLGIADQYGLALHRAHDIGARQGLTISSSDGKEWSARSEE